MAWPIHGSSRLPRTHPPTHPSLPPPPAQYEAEGRQKRIVRAQQLWFAVLEAQIETGNPYMLYKVRGRAPGPPPGPCLVGWLSCRGQGRLRRLRWPSPTYARARAPPRPQDSCNRKSNQQNLGTIKCSNLCTEILEYTSEDETAVCNLASIALPRYVREKSDQGRG